MDLTKLSACLHRRGGAEESWQGVEAGSGGKEGRGERPPLVPGLGMGAQVNASIASVRNHTLRRRTLRANLLFPLDQTTWRLFFLRDTVFCRILIDFTYNKNCSSHQANSGNTVF